VKFDFVDETTNRGVQLQRELYLQEIHKALRKESDRINQVINTLVEIKKIESM